MKKYLPALFLAGLLAGSCKKGENNQAAEIELTKSRDTVSLVILYTLPVEEETNFIEVQLANGEVAAADINVTLVKNQALVSSYNNLKGRTYEDMPSSLFTIAGSGSPEIVIPKGQRSAWLRCKIAKGAYNFSKTYALGYTIQSVSGRNKVNMSKKDLIVIIRVANDYDGVYASKGFGIHPSLGNHPWNSPCTDNFFILTSSGPNSVDLKPGHPVGTTSVFGYLSSVLPRFTINASNNAITVSDAPGNSVTFDPYPAYPSRWDPFYKIIYVKLGWSGTRVFTDTFTWCKPRGF